MNEYILKQPIEHEKHYSTKYRVAFCNQPFLSNGKFSETCYAFLSIKRKHKYKIILKNIPQKNEFSQSPKSTKNYSSNYNSYRSVVNIAENFRHVLHTKIVLFPDHEKLLKVLDSG